MVHWPLWDGVKGIHLCCLCLPTSYWLLPSPKQLPPFFVQKLAQLSKKKGKQMNNIAKQAMIKETLYA